MQYLVWIGGVLAMLRTRRLARRALAEQGTIVRPLPQALRARRQARRNSRPKN